MGSAAKLPLKIVLIEDDASDVELVQRVVFQASEEAYPWSLTSVATLAEAVDLLDCPSTSCDIVILSLDLAEGFGLDAVKELVPAAETSDAAIVALTAADDEALGVEAVGLGADEYLTKGDTWALELPRVIRYAAELKHRQRQLAAATEAAHRAQLANRAKSDLLATMIHDIRTPLNAVLGFTHLISREEDLSSQIRERIGSVGKAGDHLMTLVNDVGEMSKIEAGVSVAVSEPFRLEQLLDSVGEVFAPAARSKGLNLNLAVADNLPVVVRGDAGKLRQILYNLVGNATKFTNEGRIVLRATLIESEANQHRVRFEVEDTGPGIPSEQVERIFEPFKPGSAQGLGDSGAGLGLALSRRLAGVMGSVLQVQSYVGQGSVFSVELNFADSRDHELKDPAIQTFRRLRADAGEVRVLAADDDEFNREILTAMLIASGFAARHVSDGVDALKEFEAWKPHAVLMDRRMPGMDGLETTRRIKQTSHGKSTPVIMVSACVFERDQSAAMDCGVDGFLSKPIRLEKLLDVLEGALDLDFETEFPQAALRNSNKTVSFDPVDFPAAPANFDADCRRQLCEAARACRHQQLLELQREVSAVHPDFGAALRGLIDTYQYDRLAEVLKLNAA